MCSLNDADLLAAYASQRSEEAFAILVERHLPLIYSAALRQVQDPHLAQDISQAVIIILARKAAGLNKETVLAGWLCCTTRLVARNALKARRRREHHELEAYMESIRQEPEPDAWLKIAPLLDEAVAALDMADRNAIVLRYYQQKSLEEVGQTLGVNPDTAQKRVARALEKLRKYFGKRGMPLTASIIASTVAAHSVQAAPAGLATTITATAMNGTVAGSSTLSQILGASKTMAWIKTKTAIVVSLSVLLATGTTSVWVAYHARPKPDQRQRVTTQSPVAEPILLAWQQGNKPDAINKFLEADWSSRPLFAAISSLSLSEDQFKLLTTADRQAKSSEMISQLNMLKQLTAAVSQTGTNAAATGNTAQARKCFTALKQCGTALDDANCLQMIRLVGKALNTKADQELAKLGQ